MKGDDYVKVSEVDFELLHKLIKSVPQGMEIESIDLTNGYSLKLIAGTNEMYELETADALRELNALLDTFKRLDVGNAKSLLDSAQQKLSANNLKDGNA